MNLYEIDNEMMLLIDDETGEIKDFESFSKLNIERDKKLSNTALWIKNLKAEIAALKVEKDSFIKRQRKAENMVDTLSQYLEQVLAGQAFKTSKVVCSFRKSTIVDIQNEQVFVEWAKNNNFDELLTYKGPVPNKPAIKQAIIDGIEVKCVSLIDRFNLNVK